MQYCDHSHVYQPITGLHEHHVTQQPINYKFWLLVNGIHKTKTATTNATFKNNQWTDENVTTITFLRSTHKWHGLSPAMKWLNVMTRSVTEQKRLLSTNFDLVKFDFKSDQFWHDSRKSRKKYHFDNIVNVWVIRQTRHFKWTVDFLEKRLSKFENIIRNHQLLFLVRLAFQL